MDRRRVNGPESGSYTPFYKAKSSQEINAKVPIFKSRAQPDEGNERRSLEANRSIFMKCGMVSNASGSAYIEAGNTKIIAAVYGPMAQARSEGYKEKGSLNIDFKFSTFSCQNERRAFLKDPEEQELLLRINEALCPAVKLESYPKSVIQITIIVLENDGSCLGHAITCASLALMNAGIEMIDIVVGASVGLFPGNVLATDCTEWERKFYGQSGELVLGYLLSSGYISQIIFNGCIVETPILSQAIAMATEACLSTKEALLLTMKESLN